jgi:tetratricopeptide (TPR) repeat protein
MSKRKDSTENEDLPLFRIMSGATGGPSTGHGLTYQVDYAVLQALVLITKTLASPLEHLHLVIEPRTISETGVTRWDIALQPLDVNIEVKVNPTRKDIEEWLDTIRIAASSFPKRIFRFVFSEGNNSLLTTIKQMRRIATECNDNREKFNFLVSGEQIKDAETILKELGENAYLILQQIEIIQIHETVLEEHVYTTARTIAGEFGGEQLYRLLFDKFYHGISGRRSFSIKELIAEARNKRINITYQPQITSLDYDPLISATLFLLQDCSDGLPVEVIASAIGCDHEKLRRAAEKFLRSGEIVEDDDTWFVNNLTSDLEHEHGSNIISRALETLLKYIEFHKKEDKSLKQIDNAISLAEVCIEYHPQSVVQLFPTLDKLLKSRGNVQLVMDVAQLSIEAARYTKERSRETAEAVARCYVCGVSWAYQRMPGHLADARISYLKSRQIAEDINAHITLAFISKCLGRLCRIEVEQQEMSRDQKDAKLHESISLLEESIKRFNELQDLPQNLKNHEIADAYSLLGRTYLVMGNRSEAQNAVRRAFDLMENYNSKEFADLLILSGDIEAIYGERSVAETTYNRALTQYVDSGKLQASEIHARILRQRGLNYKAWGKISLAKTDFQKAAEIWDMLNRPENAAIARWEIISIEKGLPTQLIYRLEKEESIIKVAVVELYQRKMAERGQAKSHLSSRAKPDNNFVESLIKQAREQIAIANLND